MTHIGYCNRWLLLPSSEAARARPVFPRDLAQAGPSSAADRAGCKLGKRCIHLSYQISYGSERHLTQHPARNGSLTFNVNRAPQIWCPRQWHGAHGVRRPAAHVAAHGTGDSRRSNLRWATSAEPPPTSSTTAPCCAARRSGRRCSRQRTSTRSTRGAHATGNMAVEVAEQYGVSRHYSCWALPSSATSTSTKPAPVSSGSASPCAANS